MASIIIKNAKIQKNNDLYRMTHTIYEDGRKIELFCDVQEEYGKYLCPEIADGILYLCLPVALREGYDIVSEIPVSEYFLHQINENLIPHLVMGDKRLKKISIHAPTTNVVYNGNGVGTGVSCGVDSTYAIMKYTNGVYKDLQLTHLFVASASVDLDDTNEADMKKWIHEHQSYFNRYSSIAKEINRPLICVYSNYIQYICKGRKNRIAHLYSHNYITMANVLALKKLWKAYIFASSVPFTFFDLVDNSYKDTDRHELLSMHVLSIPGFYCFSGGVKSTRIEKTLELSDYPVAQKYLHPCFTKEEKNCSKPTCAKCIRALLTFDFYDKLDNMKNVFDVDTYKTKKIEYLVQLVKNKDNEFLAELYEMFHQKYPQEMKRAEKLYEDMSMPVPRDAFNLLNSTYAIAMDLLKLRDPRSSLANIFKNIDKICVIGQSRLGDVIIDLLKEKMKIYYYDDEHAKNIDTCIIMCVENKFIFDARRKLESTPNIKHVYTLFDIYKNIKLNVDLQGKNLH